MKKSLDILGFIIIWALFLFFIGLIWAGLSDLISNGYDRVVIGMILLFAGLAFILGVLLKKQFKYPFNLIKNNKSWLKENWFKISLVLLAIIFIYFSEIRPVIIKNSCTHSYDYSNCLRKNGL